MSARVYTVSMKNATISGAPTLVFVNPGTTASIQILRAGCSQYGTSTAQQIGVQLSTQVTAFPTLVSATPAKHGGGTTDPVSVITGGTAGAAGTSGVNASAEGAGAKTVILPDSFNNLSGWLYVPTPEEYITLPAGSAAGLGLVLLTTPTTLTGWNAFLTFREV